MSMNLIYHPMSPYSRKVYAYALEHGLADKMDLQKVVVCPVLYKGWSDNNDEVAQSNPMAKIPTLVTEDCPGGVYDSDVILEYLDMLSKKPSFPAHEISHSVIQATANGILDAEVLIVYEEKIRKEAGVLFQPWIDGQRLKGKRGLDRLEADAKAGKLTQVPDDKIACKAFVAVSCTLGFMDERKVEWREGRPNLDKWFTEWQKRKSFVGTGPFIDWKSGSGKGIGFLPF